MKTPRLVPIATLFALTLTTSCLATVITVPFGTAAPPATLGGYTMAQFSDPRPEGSLVTDIAPPATSPVVGNLLFDAELEHLRVGSAWDTWSHPYTGDVYWFDELTYGNSLTMTLPGGTTAFYLYVEPDFFGTFAFGFSAGGGVLEIAIDGEGGAQGVGFYTDDPAVWLDSVIIQKVVTDPNDPFADFSNGFGVGEFGINGVPGVPDGGASVLLLGLALAGLGAARKQVK